MPRGASRKREHEYEDLKRAFKRDGRYPGREEEVAARIVNKQRAQYGETQSERARDRQGASPDPGLPIGNYDALTIGEIRRELPRLSPEDRRTVRQYEQRHKARKTLLAQMDRSQEGETARRAASRR